MNENLVKKIEERLQGESNMHWIRFINGVGQSELALKIGRSQAYVSLLENGWQMPTAKEHEILAEALGVTTSDLIFKLRE